MKLTLAAAQSGSVAGDIAANVERHLRFSAIAADLGAQLLIFPELSLTGYELSLARSCVLTPDSPVLDPLRKAAIETRMAIVAGAPVPNGTGSLYLAALIFSPDGGVSVYSKQHVHSSEAGVFRDGIGGAPVRIGDVSVSLAICRDASFPEHAAAAAAQAADVYAVGAMIDEADYEWKASLLRDHSARHSMAIILANHAGSSGGSKSAGRSAVWWRGEISAASGDSEECLVLARDSGGQWTGSVERIR
jgi:predicted amidohydrolase